ncbi:MAG: hypothetical protein HFH14_04475 [Lachnospiraceae bacterium]|nr:hypothetical protein [Lachnospiraceae bacterium]
MENISILDCTLRDGGYVNDWSFGGKAISDILHKLCRTNVDILEVGFLRDEPYISDRVVFNSMRQVKELCSGIDRNNNMKLAVMAEISRPIPLEMIEPAGANDTDIIRVIVWKTKKINGKTVDALQESYDYCRGIVNKGYKLCIQPNRTDQYSDLEFRNMVEMFSALSPMAIYVVDSWGTMYSNQVLHYMDMADRLLRKDISIGFHGHNNMMQAFSTAEKIVERRYDRNIILDASVYGIGRGAGNLNLELITRYLNEVHGCNYDIEPMLEIYDNYLKEFKKKYEWGSSMPYMVSASFGANPNYAAYYNNKLSAIQMKKAFQSMTADDKVLYSDALAQRYQGKCYE